MALQERNFSVDIPSKTTSPETEKLVNLLEERIKEKEQTITKLQSELKARNDQVKQLAGTVNQLRDEANSLKDDWGIRENEVAEKMATLQRELGEEKEKHELELNEKKNIIKEKDERLKKSEEIVLKLQSEIVNSDNKSMESSNERLLLLDTEKERQFLDEKRAFQESLKELQSELGRVTDERNELKKALETPTKELQEELNRLSAERSQLVKDLEKAQHNVEVKNKEAKEATAKMLKAKGQMKSKITNLEKQNGKLVKELEIIRKVCKNNQFIYNKSIIAAPVFIRKHLEFITIISKF